MTPLRWAEQAADDLLAIRTYFERDSIAYARTLIEDLYAAAGHLREFPELGRVVPERNDPELRELVVRSYRVVYRYRGELAELLTIFHSSRPLPDTVR